MMLARPLHPVLFRVGLLGMAAVGLSAPAQAQAGYASLPAIDRAVAAFTGADIGLPGGASLPVDRRLRLRECSSPLELSWRGARHDTVVVQCPDAGSWHLFVPVQSHVGQVGANAVDRGDSITIAVTGDGFSVSQPGEAMGPGAVGDWIRVRSVKDGSPRTDSMRAKIVRPGEVEVPLP